MHTNKILEFDTILQRLSDLALSDAAKERLLALTPSLSQAVCRRRMEETGQTRAMLDSHGTPPLVPMKELPKILELANKGAMLTPAQLCSVQQFLNACRRMQAYLKKAQEQGGAVAGYGASLDELQGLYDEIERSIRSERVDDEASGELRRIRRKLAAANEAVKAKLEQILRGKKQWFADGYVTTRQGHWVLPVKREYKNQVDGMIIETSGTGGTVFVEPSAVRRLQGEAADLKIQEENEIRRILYTLTALVDENAPMLHANRECMETLDFLFAKGRLSQEMQAISVPLSTEREIIIRGGRHPLLPKESCVPLDFTIGKERRGVVITGPNTGGKTVALKTVGLLSLMAQCGLHLPVQAGSTLCLHAAVLCDIGDGQSISENLSTFSAHLGNIIEILNEATSESLVLLDELGSGTDPAEGMGLAVAVLDELQDRGCLFVATTHYPEIKEFAHRAPHMENACMAFDRESLRPLYRLIVGEAGESCALYIARRLGFPERLLKRAYDEAYASRDNDKKAPEMTFLNPAQGQERSPAPSCKIRPEAAASENPQAGGGQYKMGDSVMVSPQNETGIVYRPADAKGMLMVQIKGKKTEVSHKRITLVVAARDLYPPDYDFSILFDTVENRKARRKMEKGHRPDLQVTYEPER